MKRKIYKLILSAKQGLFALALTVFCGTAYSQQTYTFNSTGSIQTLNLQGGDYKIECWGGDGGLGNINSGAVPNSQIAGGVGGYSSGKITITSATTWYINVGGRGADGFLNTTAPGGYNGGGNGSVNSTHRGGGGGGATHVATATGVLSSLSGNQSAVIIVGGGGGGGGNQSIGGDGGGLNGIQPPNSTQFSNRIAGGGGTQTTGGACQSGGTGAVFGQGGTSTQNLAGGGGGGWYGGCTGENSTGGGGGSGYIGGVTNATTVVFGQPGFVANPDVTGNGYVIITRLCDVNLTASKNPICLGESITLSTNAGSAIQWNTGASTSSITVTPSSTTSYTVSGVSSSSTACSSTVTILITVNPLPVISAVTFPAVFCAGASGSIIASGAVSYSWSNGTTGSSTLVNPTVTTVYTATGTSIHGCKTTETVMVNVNTNSLTVTPNTTICKGTTINLTASGVNSVLWSDGAPFFTIVVTPSVTTAYSVSGQDALGCTLSNTVLITVNNVPAVTVSASKQTICRGETVTLTATGANSYVWDNADSNPTSTRILHVDIPYHYTVTGTDANGCSSTATITVVAVACTGIQENGRNSVSIFPNPTTKEITISTNGSGRKLITVTDLLGKVVLSEETGDSVYKLNVENLPAGLFNVRVQEDNLITDKKFGKQ